MTEEPEDKGVTAPAKPKKTNWAGWIAGAAIALGGLATLVDKNSPSSDDPSYIKFENRYDQKRTANISCAGKWGEERKACHALFGD
jgi:hypothetical protein